MTRTRTIGKALFLLAAFGLALAFALTARGTAQAEVLPPHPPSTAGPAHLLIRYTVQQPTCSRFEVGWHATVVPGRDNPLAPPPFPVVCRQNGPEPVMFTWDATR